jgi:hypothetical protein
LVGSRAIGYEYDSIAASCFLADMWVIRSA